MAFQLKRTKQATGKVVVSYVDPDKVGVEKQDNFVAKFDLITQDEYESILRQIDEGDLTVRDVVKEKFKGVEGEFVDFDGNKTSDFELIKEGLLSESNYVTALWKTWNQLQNAIKQKNSRR